MRLGCGVRLRDALRWGGAVELWRPVRRRVTVGRGGWVTDIVTVYRYAFRHRNRSDLRFSCSVTPFVTATVAISGFHDPYRLSSLPVPNTNLINVKSSYIFGCSFPYIRNIKHANHTMGKTISKIIVRKPRMLIKSNGMIM